MPAVSVIVPCHKAHGTIADTIESVLAQTFTDWECILVSDDGTSPLDHLKALGISDPRLIEQPERSVASGTVAPRNRGLSIARGGLIADLDADDIWLPGRLQKLVPLAHEHGVAQDVLECFSGDRILGYSGGRDGAVAFLRSADVVAFDFPFHLVVRRELMGDEWFWHDSFVQDAYRAAWLAATSPVAWLREPLMRYRAATGSASQGLAGSRRIEVSYDRVLDSLRSGEGAVFSSDDRTRVIAGFERKKALNQRHIHAVENEGAAPAFIEWILRERISGEPAG